jgi:tetratricopeptide (TPR) repeat protein
LERAKYLIALISCFLIVSPDAFCGNREKIYDAYISGHMDNWKRIIDEMERNKNMGSGAILELINYQYGYIAWCMGEDNKKEAREYLELAEGNLDILEDRGYKPSQTNFYRSTFSAFKISFNIIKAPFLGPKSLKYAELSIEQDPQNPFAQLVNGSARFFMPENLGGSKETGIKHYLKALELMEIDGGYTDNDWNYLNLLAAIGQAYEETGQNNEAIKYYRKALEAEPSFSWVKNELLPNLLNKKN